MLRGLAIALVAVLAACSAKEPDDYILYKPLTPGADGPVASRTLLVTAGPGVLLVSRVFKHGVEIRTGTITRPTWEDLRVRLTRARYLPKRSATPLEDPRTFQIYASLGRVTVDVIRDPRAPVEAEVRDVRADLEKIAKSLTTPKDPVLALEPFLSSDEPRVRDQATTALLALRTDRTRPAEVRREAEKALQDRARLEDDPAILEQIRER